MKKGLRLTISSSDYDSIALKSDDTVWAWGLTKDAQNLSIPASNGNA